MPLWTVEQVRSALPSSLVLRATQPVVMFNGTAYPMRTRNMPDLSALAEECINKTVLVCEPISSSNHDDPYDGRYVIRYAVCNETAGVSI